MMELNKKIAFYTLGCKLNFSETSSIAQQFIDAGYTIVDFKELAEVYVIHSCTVTALADKKTRQAIRQANRLNSSATIAVIGCGSQLRSAAIAEIEGVNVILGNEDKFDLLQYIESLTGEKVIKANQMNNAATFVPTYSLEGRTRSFFKVQDRCDQFCAYCAIPLARGRSRSHTIANTIKVANEIGESDAKEIVLTGVNIGDFGRKNNETFFELLQALENVGGIERIRISSVEPDLLTNDIIQLVAHSNKLQPHFHLPLQSGSDKLLKLMKRHYDTQLFADRVKTIKQLLPDACIAVDVIVGLPGETDDDFNDTYQFLKSQPVTYFHVFTYSERADTRAIALGESVPIIIRNERSKKLHQLSDTMKLNFYLSQKGKSVEVLWESDCTDGYMFGFTSNYVRVKTKFNEQLINTISSEVLQTLDADGVYII